MVDISERRLKKLLNAFTFEIEDYVKDVYDSFEKKIDDLNEQISELEEENKRLGKIADDEYGYGA